MTAPLPPLIARRYVLHESLGQGGMGTVYRAYDRLTGRDVALKRVLYSDQLSVATDTTNGEEFRVALAREFKLAASLRHPNIVQMLDYGFDEAHEPFFTMELLPSAQTLVNACQNQSLETRLHLFVQVLHALAYVHRRGIIHHDLKPANVLVVDNQVKLLDFGLAMMHERTHMDDNIVTAGTLAYMAPEILLGSGGSVASDLYAVGMMAYEVLAGEHPFSIRQASRLVQEVLSLMPSVHAMDVPHELGYVFWRLLAKDPLERFVAATDVIRAINEAGVGQYPIESSAGRESYLQAARLVSREQEVAQLSEALHNASQQRGQLIVIGGESGVGKSRLMDELRALAMVRGAVVMRGQANNVASRPLELWLPIVRWLCLLAAEVTSEEVGLLGMLIPEFDRLIGKKAEFADTPNLSPEGLLQGLEAFITRVVGASRVPLLILLDDLQWAGSESVRLLARLQTSVATLPLLLVATYRDNEAPTLTSYLSQATSMKLRRLDAKGIAQLSEAMLGNAGRRERVVDLLRRESEGNIFFIIEVVRVLANEVDHLENIGLATLPPTVLSGSVKQVMLRRVENLSADYRFLVQIAAVMGRTLNLHTLHLIASAIDLQDWLTECANSAVLEAEDEQWRFTHDKLREAMLDQLSSHEKQALHYQIALALEQTFDRQPESAAALAYHWRGADHATQEDHYGMLAGQQALRTGGYQEALNAFQRAQELLPHLNIDEPARVARHIHLYELIGTVLLARGSYEAARLQFEDMLLLAQQSESVLQQISAYRLLGTTALAMTQSESALDHMTRALRLLDTMDDHSERVSVLSQLGDVYTELGDHDTAQRCYQESWRLSRRSATGRPEQIIPTSEGDSSVDNQHMAAVLAAYEANQGDVTIAALLALARASAQQGDVMTTFAIAAYLTQSVDTPEQFIDEVETLVYQLQPLLDPGVASTAWEQARSRSLDDLINSLRESD